MADFIIAGPDGKKYKVSGENAEGALAALKKSLGQAGAVTAPSEPSLAPNMAAAKAARAGTLQVSPEAAQKQAQFDAAHSGDLVTAARKKPDGTYGQPPEGMILNPITGQMTSRELLAGNIDPGMAASAITGGAQGATLGLSDEGIGALNAVIPGKGTAGERYDFGREYARAMLDAARRDHPVAAYGGEIGGALALPLGAIKSTGKLALDMGKSALTGGLMSGGYAAGAADGGLSERASAAKDAALIGGAVGGAIPLAGAGIKKIAESLMARRAIKAAGANAPTTEQLRTAGNAAYKAIDDSGVSVKADVAKSKLADIADALRGEGVGLDVGGKVFPASRAVMDAAEGFTEGKNTIPFRDLDILRRFTGASAASNLANKADTRLATGARAAMDDMVMGLTPNDVDAGDLQALQTMLPKARELWSKMSKSQMVDDAIEAGSNNYLSGPASGIRNQFARILRNPKLARGFTDAEKRAMKGVIGGSIPERALHLAAGGMGKLMTALGGFAGGGLPGAAAGAGLSFGLQKASEAVAMHNAQIARALVANGGKVSLPQLNPQTRAIIEQLMRQGAMPAAN